MKIRHKWMQSSSFTRSLIIMNHAVYIMPYQATTVLYIWFLMVSNNLVDLQIYEVEVTIYDLEMLHCNNRYWKNMQLLLRSL